MWRMMRVLNLRVRNSARAFDLVLDLGGGAAFEQSPIGEQLEEHRHEEDGEEGRRHHPAHDAGADRAARAGARAGREGERRSEEHTSELQSLAYLVCRLLLEKKKEHIWHCSRARATGL